MKKIKLKKFWIKNNHICNFNKKLLYISDFLEIKERKRNSGIDVR